MGRRPAYRVTAQVDLYGGTAAAVSIVASKRRWPENETVDRLNLSVHLAALTLLSTKRGLMPRVRHQIMGIAAALVEAPPPRGSGESWAEAVASRRLVQRRDPGQPRIVVKLLGTRDGPVARVVGPAPTSLALAAATAAIAGAALSETTVDVHLSAALAMEGMLLWHRTDRAAAGASQNGVSESLAYAIMRLAEAHEPTPKALLEAESAHRLAASQESPFT